MIQQIRYGDKLDRYVETENLIPYRLHANSRFRKNCYYWIAFDNAWFKVEEVQYNFKKSPTPILDHIIVVWMDGMYSYLCTDLCIYDYRLEKDKFKIRDVEIINSQLSFAGGEIEYWFFKHHINFIDPKYKGFQKFFDTYSRCRIDPDKFYFIKADLINGEYRHIRFEVDPKHEKFHKPLRRENIPPEAYIVKITHEDIEKERRRRRRKHEKKYRKNV